MTKTNKKAIARRKKNEAAFSESLAQVIRAAGNYMYRLPSRDAARLKKDIDAVRSGAVLQPEAPEQLLLPTPAKEEKIIALPTPAKKAAKVIKAVKKAA